MKLSNGIPKTGFVIGSCLIISLLAACSAPAEPVAAPAPVAVPETATPAKIPVAESILRGYYEARDDGLFTACGETSRRRVSALSGKSQAALAQLAGDTDQARFVIAQGRLIDRDVAELGDFELISSDAWNCESRFDEFIYAARGVDGFWSLEVTPASVSFVVTPGSKPLLFAYQTFARVGEELKFAAEGAGNSIQVSLRKEACLDRMTDTVFAHRAVILADGASYEGCAWRGRAEP